MTLDLNVDFNGIRGTLEKIRDSVNETSVNIRKELRNHFGDIYDEAKIVSQSFADLRSNFNYLRATLANINSFEDLKNALTEVPRLMVGMIDSTIRMVDSFERLSRFDFAKLFSDLNRGLNNSYEAIGKKTSALFGMKFFKLKILLPVALVVAALGALAIAIRHLWRTNEQFKNFITRAWESIRNLYSSVVGFIIGLFTDFNGTLTRMGSGIRNFFSNIDPRAAFDVFRRFIPTIIAKLIGGLPSLLLRGVAMMASLGDGVGKGIPDLIGMATELIVRFADKIVDAIPILIETGVSILLTLLTGILGVLPTLINTVTTIITRFAELITENLPIIIEAGISILTNLIEGIVGVLPRIIDVALNLVMSLFNALIDNLGIILDAGIQLLMSLIEGVVEHLPALINAAINIIKSLFTAIIDNLPQILDAGIRILLALVEGIISVLPSLLEAAWNLIRSLFDALIENAPQIFRAGIQILVALIDGIKSIIESLLSLAWDLIKRFVRALGERVRDVRNQGREILNSIVDGIKSLLNRMTEIGRNIIQGLINGITGMFGRVASVISDLGSRMLGGITSFFGINSPSKLMRNTVGKPIVQGICEGIDETAYLAVNSMEKLGENLKKCAKDIAEDLEFYPSNNLKLGEQNFSATPRKSNGINNHFNISSLVVREEADIEKISRELFKLQQNNARALGAFA